MFSSKQDSRRCAKPAVTADGSEILGLPDQTNGGKLLEALTHRLFSKAAASVYGLPPFSWLGLRAAVLFFWLHSTAAVEASFASAGLCIQIQESLDEFYPALLGQICQKRHTTNVFIDILRCGQPSSWQQP